MVLTFVVRNQDEGTTKARWGVYVVRPVLMCSPNVVSGMW